MTNVHHLQTLSTSTHAPLPISWIEHLFEKMSLSYGRKFTDQWAGMDPNKLKQYWAKELATMTPAELSRGCAALDGRDWPPTLPEFKKLCRPPIDPTVAYYEAVNGAGERERGNKGEWSHPAIFWAAASMTYDLLHLTYSAVKSQWEKALSEQMAKCEWHPIPEPRIALPAPGKGSADRQQAERMLAQYRDQVADRKTDDRSWIRKVLERAKNNDATLPPISIRFAQEALEGR